MPPPALLDVVGLVTPLDVGEVEVVYALEETLSNEKVPILGVGCNGLVGLIRVVSLFI